LEITRTYLCVVFKDDYFGMAIDLKCQKRKFADLFI